jgi:hypothetical protein
MIALGGIFAMLVPYIPTALALLAGLGTAVHGVPQVVSDHPTATAVGSGIAGAVLHLLPSPVASSTK